MGKLLARHLEKGGPYQVHRKTEGRTFTAREKFPKYWQLGGRLVRAIGFGFDLRARAFPGQFGKLLPYSRFKKPNHST